MEQLLVHLLGDYWLQSDVLALNKHKNSLCCFVHVIIYTACFLILTQNWLALLVIGGTHFLIDRFSLAKYLIWAKNHISPCGYAPWRACDLTGYYDSEAYSTSLYERRPIWITVWLYIISDNSLHLACNYFALKFFNGQ